ncbi:MAG: helix-turn-helix domain-containing protein [Actinomycetes bacterium]
MATPHVLTHPIRLRIVMALVGDRQLTTYEIAEEMPDVPTATLYRHIAALSDAGVLDVVAERRVRGAVERTFALRPGGGLVGQAGAAKMTQEEKSAAFGVFAAGLIAAYDGYLANPDAGGQLAEADWQNLDWDDSRTDVGEAAKEAAGYRALALYLDVNDLTTMAEALKAALEPYFAPVEGKQRVLFGTVFIPT